MDENYFQQKIEHKLDNIMDAVRSSIDTNTEMLIEIKRITDVFAIHSSHMEKENNRLWTEFQSERASLKNLDERVDKIETELARLGIKFEFQTSTSDDKPNIVFNKNKKLHVNQDFDGLVTNWIHTNLGKLIIAILGLIATVMITDLARQLKLF